MALYRGRDASRGDSAAGTPVGTPTSTPAALPMEDDLWTLDRYEAKELKWLWYPYIPIGSITMLYGPPGIGKSFAAYAIASAITNGIALPGQETPSRPQNVLLMSAEDDPSYIIRPRMEAMGANISRVSIPQRPITLDAAGQKDIKSWLGRCAAGVIFIDPLTLYMGGRTDLHRMNQVYDMLKTLQQIAGETDTTIIVVHHSRKGDEGNYLDRAAGSQALGAAIRSGLFVHEEEGVKIISHAKHNYSPQGPSLTYTVDENGVFHWGDVIDEGPFAFSGQKRRSGKASEKAVVFLKAFLANGAVPAKELLSAAEDEGFSIATLNRVKPGVAESFCMRKFGQTEWYWRLIDQA